MKTSFISNLSVQSAMRSTINQVQNELIDSQREVVSGRYSNIGEQLGATTSRSLNLHRDLSMMDNLLSTNSVVTQRLSSTQMAMETISNAGQTGLNTLVALSGSTDSTQLATAAQTLSDVLDQFTDAANTSVNGEYVLAGINTDNKPVNSYLTDEGGAKTAFDNAFTGYFGFAQTDPATINITPTDMQDFMDTVVEPMFTGADSEANSVFPRIACPSPIRLCRRRSTSSSSTSMISKGWMSTRRRRGSPR
jgi:flagellar hook-associated protein 3 FlgL